MAWKTLSWTRRSSTSEPRPDLTFFTDRDLGRSVAAALLDAGLHVEPYHKHFSLDDVPDIEWLRYIGTKGWIVLSHNKFIRYERNELDELMTSRVKAFFIIGKGPHSSSVTGILRNLSGIYRCVRENADPFVAKVYQNRDEVSLWLTYAQWLKERRA